MDDDELRQLVEEVCRQFASLVISSTSATGHSPKTEAIIMKTLADLHVKLRDDPATLVDLIRRTKITKPPPES